MSIIKVIPIPNNTFTSNIITIYNPIKDNIYDYDHTGTYKIKCSSYANNYPPYNAFNKLNNTYWQCGNNNDTFYSDTCKITSYSTNPYKNVRVNNGYENSSYQGGNATKHATNVGTIGQNKIYGEWIQIQIPKASKLYLRDYSILTPVPTPGNSTFPTKFMVVGSNDQTTWEYIDLQNKNNVDTTFQKPIVFNVNSTNSSSLNLYTIEILSLSINFLT